MACIPVRGWVFDPGRGLKLAPSRRPERHHERPLTLLKRMQSPPARNAEIDPPDELKCSFRPAIGNSASVVDLAGSATRV